MFLNIFSINKYAQKFSRYTLKYTNFLFGGTIFEDLNKSHSRSLHPFSALFYFFIKKKSYLVNNNVSNSHHTLKVANISSGSTILVLENFF